MPLPIAYHTVLSLSAASAIEQVVCEQRSLEDVLAWCQVQRPPRWVDDIITQDEFTLDVIVQVDDHSWLAYDTT